MIKNRILFSLLILVSVFSLASCQIGPPIPTANYSKLTIGMTEPQVYEALGANPSLFQDDGGPDDFYTHGYNHSERNLLYQGANGACTQTIRVQFKNYVNVPQFHDHFDAFLLTSYDVTNSSGCGAVIK